MKAATEAGVSTAEQLRAMSAADVTAKFRSAGMIVDGWVLPEDPIGRVRGRAAECGRRAGRLEPGRVVLLGAGEARAVRAAGAHALRRSRGRVPQGLSACDRGRSGRLDRRRTSATARFGTCGCTRTSRRRRARRRISITSPESARAGRQPELPATHASEVPYVFNNLGQLPLFPDRSIAELAGASAPDKKVADEMSSYSGELRPALAIRTERACRLGHRTSRSTRGTPQSSTPILRRRSCHAPARLAFFDKLWDRQRHAGH